MIAACVHTMFRVQKERDRMALVTPPAPELRNRTRIAMPPKPNSTFTPCYQAKPKRPKRKAISKTLRFEIFKRDGFKCQYCGSTPPKAVLHVDHIIPVAKGGGNTDGNLTTACSVCNGGKGVRDLTLAPATLAERAAAVAEQEEQLRGFSQIMEAQRLRIDADVWTMVRSLYGEETDSINRSIYQSIKTILARIPMHQCREAAEIALAKYHPRLRSFFPYFCGICWRMIKADAA